MQHGQPNKKNAFLRFKNYYYRDSTRYAEALLWGSWVGFLIWCIYPLVANQWNASGNSSLSLIISNS